MNPLTRVLLTWLIAIVFIFSLNTTVSADHTWMPYNSHYVFGKGNIDSEMYNTSGSYTWTDPNGTTQINISITGGGGGGSGSYLNTDQYYGGLGGSAGSNNATTLYSVTPNTQYTLTIGAGGSGGNGGSGHTCPPGIAGTSTTAFGLVANGAAAQTTCQNGGIVYGGNGANGNLEGVSDAQPGVITAGVGRYGYPGSGSGSGGGGGGVSSGGSTFGGGKGSTGVVFINYTNPYSVNISYTPSMPYSPNTIIFNDTSAWQSPTNFNWSFGDGTFSYTDNTTHVYTTAGVYTVTFTLTNASNVQQTSTIVVYNSIKPYLWTSFNGHFRAIIGSNGYELYNQTGTFSWTDPSYVTTVNEIDLVGGGGGGADAIIGLTGGSGGGAGSVTSLYGTAVTPGSTYTNLIIGAGGSGGNNTILNGSYGATTYGFSTSSNGGYGGNLTNNALGGGNGLLGDFDLQSYFDAQNGTGDYDTLNNGVFPIVGSNFNAGGNGYGSGGGGGGVSSGVGGNGANGAILLQYTIPVPIPSFTSNVTTGLNPLGVQFNDTSSALGSPATVWNWSFGDGTWQNGSTQNATHQYISSGLFTVTLLENNTVGSNSTTVNNYINVIPPTMLPSFTSNVTVATTTQVVQFNDTSNTISGVLPQMWNWSFGDGTWFNTTSVASKNATHMFSVIGPYNVGLTTSNTTYSVTNTTTQFGYIQSIFTPATNAGEFYIPGVVYVTPGNTTVTGIQITLLNISSSYSASYTSQNDGSFGFGDLQNGNYEVQVNTSGYYTATSGTITINNANATPVQMYIISNSQASSAFALKYPPGVVTFHVMSSLGSPLSGVNISAYAVQTSAGNYVYLAQLFGYPLTTTPIQNTLLNLVTDYQGNALATVLSSVTYQMNFSYPGYQNYSILSSPSGAYYNVIMQPNGVSEYTSMNSLSNWLVDAVNLTAVPNVNSPTTGQILVNLVDTSGTTTNGYIVVSQINTSVINSSVQTTFYNQSFTGNSTNNVATLSNVSGQSYTVTAIMNTTSNGIQTINVVVSFPQAPTPLAPLEQLGIPSYLFGFGIILLTAMVAGYSTAPSVSLVCSFEAWIFFGMGWFTSFDRSLPGGATLVVVIITLMSVASFLYLFASRKKGGY